MKRKSIYFFILLLFSVLGFYSYGQKYLNTDSIINDFYFKKYKENMNYDSLLLNGKQVITKEWFENKKVLLNQNKCYIEVRDFGSLASHENVFLFTFVSSNDKNWYAILGDNNLDEDLKLITEMYIEFKGCFNDNLKIELIQQLINSRKGIISLSP